METPKKREAPLTSQALSGSPHFHKIGSCTSAPLTRAKARRVLGFCPRKNWLPFGPVPPLLLDIVVVVVVGVVSPGALIRVALSGM